MGRFVGREMLLMGLLVFLAAQPAASSQSTGSSRATAYSLLKKAATQISAGRLSQAEATLENLLQADSSDFQAINLLGVIRAKQGRNKEAEKLFDEAVRGNPRITGAHVNLGLLYLETNRPQQAASQLKEALQLEPHRPDIMADLARALQLEAAGYAKAGDFKTALPLLLQARSLEPENVSLLFEIGMAQTRLSLYEDAAKSFSAALKLRPADAAVVLALARAEMAAKRYDLAEQSLQAYLRLRPDDAAAHYDSGYALRLLQRNQEARQEFKRALQLEPGQTESIYELGILDLEEGQMSRAAARFSQVLARSPDHLGAQLSLAQVDYDRKQYASAKTLLERVVHQAPSNYKAHYYLGLCEARLGDKASSERELALAVALERRADESQRVASGLQDARPGRAGKNEDSPPHRR